jgi:uncharacterized membrane protein
MAAIRRLLRVPAFSDVLDSKTDCCEASMKSTRGTVFLALGIVFLAIGASGQRSFLGIGIAFLAVGLAFSAREHRRDRR